MYKKRVRYYIIYLKSACVYCNRVNESFKERIPVKFYHYNTIFSYKFHDHQGIKLYCIKNNVYKGEEVCVICNKSNHRSGKSNKGFLLYNNHVIAIIGIIQRILLVTFKNLYIFNSIQAGEINQWTLYSNNHNYSHCI
jgi:hypothetical protein